MNAIGLSLIMKMGCICSRESIHVNAAKYVIKDRLGEGGFSTVDLIENSSLKKRFALKRIRCHSAEDQRLALQEIEFYKKIKHANLIELVDSTFKASDNLAADGSSMACMVFPYFRRGTLHDHLGLKSLNMDYMNAREILRIFSDICSAVKYLHDYKPEPVAHRDLKTANVCLTESMNPIIMDFGSMATARVQICGSQDAQTLQDLAAERCSMPYRAPELFNVESYCVIDERTDIWSLGCILYAMCYFKSPYDIVYERGDSVALAVLSGSVNFAESAPFTQDMHDLTMFMLTISPQERPFIDNVINKLQVYVNKLDNVA